MLLIWIFSCGISRKHKLYDEGEAMTWKTVIRWPLWPKGQASLCEHCRMKEATYLARLCIYCYWSLPGSRLVQYVGEQMHVAL